VGMGRDLFDHPAGKEVLAEAEELGWKKFVPEIPGEELARTSVAQPAIFLVEWAAFLVAKERREPEVVAGHSLGEFAALAAAEALDWPTAFKLVILRGKLMEEAAQKNPGGMLAILGLSLSDVEKVAQETGCFLANINSPAQVVLAGNFSALTNAEKMLQERGGKVVRLAVAGAFHSPFMAEAAHRFAKALDDVSFRMPKITFVSSSTGNVEHDPERIREVLKGQMTSSVMWVKAMETIAALGVEEAWEIGPGQVLTRLGRRITERVRFRALAEALNV